MTSGPQAPPSLDHRLQGSTEGRQAPGGDDPRVHPRPPVHSQGGACGQRPACWSSVVHPKGPPGAPKPGAGAPPATDLSEAGQTWPSGGAKALSLHPGEPARASRRQRPRLPHPLQGVQTAPEDTPAWASHRARGKQRQPQRPGRRERNVSQPWGGEERERWRT